MFCADIAEDFDGVRRVWLTRMANELKAMATSWGFSKPDGLQLKLSEYALQRAVERFGEAAVQQRFVGIGQYLAYALLHGVRSADLWSSLILPTMM